VTGNVAGIRTGAGTGIGIRAGIRTSNRTGIGIDFSIG
jgi:hypothetical protein